MLWKVVILEYLKRKGGSEGGRGQIVNLFYSTVVNAAQWFKKRHFGQKSYLRHFLR